MTLTEAEKLDIAKVLEVTYQTVNDQLTDLGDTWITSAVEADIRELITEWETARDEHQSIEPKDRNFGVRYDPAAKRRRIQQEMANLIYLKLENTGSRSWGRSTRG